MRRSYAGAAKRADLELRKRCLWPFGMGADRLDRLQDVARYLDSTDPMEIGAGALLETSGHKRTQLALEIA